MEVLLPQDLRERVELELARGRFRTSEQLIEEAVRYFLDEERRSEQRVEALRRIGAAADKAGLYERVLVPDEE